jgi:hypothetical protein
VTRVYLWGAGNGAVPSAQQVRQQEGSEAQAAGQVDVGSAPNIGPQGLPHEQDAIGTMPEEGSGAQRRQFAGSDDEWPVSTSGAQRGGDGASSPAQEAAEGGRRVVGPAMPPPELLAAAAEAKQAVMTCT